jgi:hypothetical protein
VRKRSGSSARGGRVAANVQRTARKIDFSDIPESSADQLKAMRRVGRPPLGEESRQLIAIQLIPGCSPSSERRHGAGAWGTKPLINEVLAHYVRKSVA